MGSRSDVEQVKSGFRRAGWWVLAIVWGACVVGGIGILSDPSYSPRALGWILLAASAVVFAVTMNRWKKVFPGLMAYAAVNSFFSIFSGHVTNNLTVSISRPEAIACTVFFLGSVALSLRFISDRLAPVDRVALFIFVFCIFWQAAAPRFEATALGVAFCSLLIAWAFSRMRDHGRLAHR